MEPKYKGIKIADPQEWTNWNSKLVHFYLKFPSYFPLKFLEMIDFCESQGINVRLEEEDKNIISQWRVINNEIRNKEAKAK